MNEGGREGGNKGEEGREKGRERLEKKGKEDTTAQCVALALRLY
jgi:hypothetical protein